MGVMLKVAKQKAKSTPHKPLRTLPRGASLLVYTHFIHKAIEVK
jgi:hypothetical protein